MGMTEAQLDTHCERILTSRRIQNKPVVLCEGSRIAYSAGRPSPQTYRQMQNMPDSSFYRACMPKWWRQYLPEFFNCGDRHDVLKTYSRLQQLHQEKGEALSYLSPDKLFAIVDLDLQKAAIAEYLFPDTESIFAHLYAETRVNTINASQHRIWVTGLIHKEAYFLLPELQAIFDAFPVAAMYKNARLSLETVIFDIADETKQDKDLQQCFPGFCYRASHCTGLDCSTIETFQRSWIAQFQNSSVTEEKTQLIFALLTLRKAKAYWQKIQPDGDWTRPMSAFKDQLLLKIAEFYAEQNDGVKYHLPYFFQHLYQLTVQPES